MSKLREKEDDGTRRCGDSTWRRLTDKFSGTANSVFHFNVEGSVAHSTHAGIPWLIYVRRELKAEAKVHSWPFDVWEACEGYSVVAEVYPALLKARFKQRVKSPHEHDAYCIAAWLSYADRNGLLSEYFYLEISQEQRRLAEKEGWILGIMGQIPEELGYTIRTCLPKTAECLTDG